MRSRFTIATGTLTPLFAASIYGYRGAEERPGQGRSVTRYAKVYRRQDAAGGPEYHEG